MRMRTPSKCSIPRKPRRSSRRESSLLEIMLAVSKGTLAETEVKFSQKSACCVILASMVGKRIFSMHSAAISEV